MKRTIAKWIHRAMGWKVVGTYPYDLPKKVIIVAPHTSSKDFWIGIWVKIWMQLDVVFYAKEELFNGLQGKLLRNLGARPVKRSKNNNLVAQAVADFAASPKHAVLLTPEGTRKKVDRFKTGFYQMALQAQVPVVPIIFDYAVREVQILEPVPVSSEGVPPISYFEDIYRGVQGKVPEDSFT
ncbi:MAG: 1-acyl-sn-glycerol-3-phosphate acyltransferase [Bacteroidota bacterium]